MKRRLLGERNVREIINILKYAQENGSSSYDATIVHMAVYDFMILFLPPYTALSLPLSEQFLSFILLIIYLLILFLILLYSYFLDAGLILMPKGSLSY